MRFSILVLSMTFAACAPQPPGAGTENHPCRTGFSANWACNDGLRCVDDTCVQCGDPGEMCCFAIGAGNEYCNGNVACEGGNGGYDGVLGACTVDSGLIGKPCCEGPDKCPGGGVCDSGVCVPKPGGSLLTQCFQGSTPHVVYVVDIECNAEQYVFYTNTPEEAEECRQQLVAAAHPQAEICALGQEPELTYVCTHHEINGFTQYQFWNCSTAKVEACAAYWCPDCDWAAVGENQC
jgi:hypothetical protein